MPVAKARLPLATARRPRHLCESPHELPLSLSQSPRKTKRPTSVSLSQVGDYFALRKFAIASKIKRGKNNQARMGTIPSETIEQIAAANDIVEVIGSYFPLKRAGTNFKALCPFHQEKTPSFTVSPSRQTFHCFGCGAGGSVFRFVMDYEHIDFPSAVRKLAARAGVTVVEKRGASDEDRQYETRKNLLKDEEGAAKYLNSPETPLFRKGNVLFGLHKSKRALIEANCAIVCEGQLDLISLFEAGITNVVAPQGTAFTDNQARILKRYVDEVVLCFDADAAGMKAAERSLEALLQKDRAWFNAFAYELTVRIAEIPAGEDPDSLIQREGKEAFEKRIAEAPEFFDYWIARSAEQTDLTSITAKMQLARQMAVALSYTRDPFLRGELASKVSSRLGVSKSDFETLLPKPQRERAGTIEAAAAAPSAPTPAHDIAMLCLLALRDETARNFLRAQKWRE